MTMTQREPQRAMAWNRVVARDWTQAEAALSLGLSERQVRRLVAAYREHGPAALVHGNAGSLPTSRPPPPSGVPGSVAIASAVAGSLPNAKGGTASWTGG